jgi:hypothetical protein
MGKWGANLVRKRKVHFTNCALLMQDLLAARLDIARSQLSFGVYVSVRKEHDKRRAVAAAS